MILFDFDGTLADTAPDMIAALNRWLAVRNRAPVEEKAVRDLCSGGARLLLNHCGLNGEDEAAAIDEYLNYYEETGYHDTALFAGIDTMLAQLHAAGMRWGIATNKPARFFTPIAERLCSASAGVPAPAALIARDDVTLRAKPHPDTLLAAAESAGATGAEAAACVYVGDDVRDAQAAQAAGMAFIGVTWGYWRPQQWETIADTLAIDALISLPSLLLPTITAVQLNRA